MRTVPNHNATLRRATIPMFTILADILNSLIYGLLSIGNSTHPFN